MIEVLFFARIREQLGVAKLSVAMSSQALTLGELREQLITENGDDWRTVLMAENVIKAVNQEVAEESQLLADGDEVAFFPPVTGG